MPTVVDGSQRACAGASGRVWLIHRSVWQSLGARPRGFGMRFSLSMACVTAMVAVGGGVQVASAQNWAGYRSGLIDVVNDPSAGWTYPNYKYETFGQFAGSMSGGSLAQTVTTNYDARATWFSFGSPTYSPRRQRAHEPLC